MYLLRGERGDGRGVGVFDLTKNYKHHEKYANKIPFFFPLPSPYSEYGKYVGGAL